MNMRRIGVSVSSTPTLSPGMMSASLRPAQAVHGDDRAFGHEILFRLEADLVLDAGRAEQFDGAQDGNGPARGSGEVSRIRSTASERMPCWARNIAVASPISPPPAISTGTSASPVARCALRAMRALPCRAALTALAL